MLTVICVYWKGKHANRNYSEVWVRRLKKMVEQSLLQSYQFVCLSNVEISGIQTILLKHNWTAWWSKIELFRLDLPGDRFLYLDLDTLPLYGLDALVDMEGSFIAISPNIADSKQRRKRGRTPYLASGVMVWDKEYANIIYDSFDEGVMNTLEGDQDWIGKVLVNNKMKFNLFPERWIKLLRDVPSNPIELPFGWKVICCSPNGWRQDCVVKHKGNRYRWVEETWKKGALVV